MGVQSQRRLRLLVLCFVTAVWCGTANALRAAAAGEDPCSPHAEEAYCENGGTCISAESGGVWTAYCICPFGTGGPECKIEIETLNHCHQMPDLRSCLTSEKGCGWCVPANSTIPASCSEFDICSGSSNPKPVDGVCAGEYLPTSVDSFESDCTDALSRAESAYLYLVWLPVIALSMRRVSMMYEQCKYGQTVADKEDADLKKERERRKALKQQRAKAAATAADGSTPPHAMAGSDSGGDTSGSGDKKPASIPLLSAQHLPSGGDSKLDSKHSPNTTGSTDTVAVHVPGSSSSDHHPMSKGGGDSHRPHSHDGEGVLLTAMTSTSDLTATKWVTVWTLRVWDTLLFIDVVSLASIGYGVVTVARHRGLLFDIFAVCLVAIEYFHTMKFSISGEALLVRRNAKELESNTAKFVLWLVHFLQLVSSFAARALLRRAFPLNEMSGAYFATADVAVALSSLTSRWLMLWLTLKATTTAAAIKAKRSAAAAASGSPSASVSHDSHSDTHSHGHGHGGGGDGGDGDELDSDDLDVSTCSEHSTFRRPRGVVLTFFAVVDLFLVVIMAGLMFEMWAIPEREVEFGFSDRERRGILVSFMSIVRTAWISLADHQPLQLKAKAH